MDLLNFPLLEKTNLRTHFFYISVTCAMLRSSGGTTTPTRLAQAFSSGSRMALDGQSAILDGLGTRSNHRPHANAAADDRMKSTKILDAGCAESPRIAASLALLLSTNTRQSRSRSWSPHVAKAHAIGCSSPWPMICFWPCDAPRIDSVFNHLRSEKLKARGNWIEQHGCIANVHEAISFRGRVREYEHWLGAPAHVDFPRPALVEVLPPEAEQTLDFFVDLPRLDFHQTFQAAEAWGTASSETLIGSEAQRAIEGVGLGLADQPLRL